MCSDVPPITAEIQPGNQKQNCIGVTGGTAHVAVASLDSLENTGGTVQAGVFAASGCPANASNIFVITRPQSQDGGLPGVNHAFYIIVS
jgi:hypothetical protein